MQNFNSSLCCADLPTVKTPQTKVVVVSGVIGIGKSTLLDQLQTRGYGVLPERVEYWREQNWLKSFYQNPEREALSFQLLVYDTGIEQVEEALKQPHDKRVLFVERYLYDQLLFWKTQVDMGRTTSMQDDSYMRIWHRWRDFVPEPSGYILLCDGISTSTSTATGGAKDPIGATNGGAKDAKDSLGATNGGTKDSLGTSTATGGAKGAKDSLGTTDCGGGVEGAKDSLGVENADNTRVEKRGRPEELKASREGDFDAYQRVLAQKHLEYFAQGTAHPPEAPLNGFPCLHVDIRRYPYHKEENTGIVELIEEWMAKNKLLH